MVGRAFPIVEQGDEQPSWEDRLEADAELRRLVLSVGGRALSDGLIFTGRQTWGIASYDGEDELDAAAGGEGEMPRWARIPPLRTPANLTRQLRMSRAAKTAISEGTGPGKRGALRRVATGAGALLLYVVFVVALHQSAFGLLGSFTLSLAASAGPFQVPLAMLLAAFVVWCCLALVLGATNLLASERSRWKFHGAEHKLIAAFERGGPAWREEVPAAPKEHKRCGTNVIFLLFATVAALDVLAWFAGLGAGVRLGLFLVGIPFLDYGIVRVISLNALGDLVSLPGLWLQRLTTEEPDERHIEAAKAAAAPVLDGILEQARSKDPT